MRPGPQSRSQILDQWDSSATILLQVIKRPLRPAKVARCGSGAQPANLSAQPQNFKIFRRREELRIAKVVDTENFWWNLA